MNKYTKNNSSGFVRSAVFAAALGLAGLAPMAAQAKPGQQACKACATVISTNTYQRAAEQGSGMGVATGAVVGGLLGNQVGDGNGRTLATIAGVVGGGYAGNAIEKRARSSTLTDVRVKMSNGTVRTFTEAGNSRWQAGSRVRVSNGHLVGR